MSSFGVLPTGFVQKQPGDIIEELEDDERAEFGVLNLLARSVLGQYNGVIAGALAGNWELANAVYQSFDPDAATGAALDRIAAITGIIRLPATQSTMSVAGGNPVTCTGTVATILLAGRVVSVQNSGERFTLDAQITLVAIGAWTPSTAYALGDRRSSNGNVYVVTTAGTSAPAGGGPAGEGEAIADGTVVWRFVGNGTAAADGDFTAENFGAIAAASAELDIETPVAGWGSAKNLADATPGGELETDAELRLRRIDLLRAQGDATVEAIRADLLEVDAVTEAIIVENDTIITDGDGRPPKSIECIVRGGDDTEVAQQVFDSKAAGITTFGFPGVIVTKTITDSQGIDHTINYSRQDDVPIWIDIAIDVDADTYVGDAAVKTALVTRGGELNMGDDVIVERMKCAVMDLTGVKDITSFIIDTQAIPPGAGTINIPIALRELATFDTARIDVVSTPT